jgi:hypothetical protein
MATDAKSRGLRLIAAIIGVAILPLTATRTAAAAAPWWQPAGLQGTRISAVVADGSTILVQTAAGVSESQRGGQFMPIPSQTVLTPPPSLVSGGLSWTISSSGQVLTGMVPAATQVAGRPALVQHPDPGAPNLGAGAHLIAAPDASPGVVVAVSTGNVVWRRGQDGDWKEALLLLPGGGTGGVPPVTGVTAFTQPISGAVTDAVYLSADGYSVMVSTDGGDDWIRAGPGLPDSVLGLSADPQTKSVYAATSDGLWVHLLQEFPAPPVYQDAALVWRWFGIVLISVAAAALGGTALILALRRLPA